ncbi:RsmF rRNA methyltransferase first C-terminal domain-containing protein [Candidatus Epulonipiscium viviparus]|uniref:RsmF rRNA methyltransferase first C-terminal domain-containing protein n=1 Tax=Candidatus Epulonipiscium viviparus TaxID=420336 RepID=UPI0004978C71|nr:RsmB/NOP family class I SAM-dependent RNA methyltransferase [Candidatus Epulopiscium viviparus]
MKTEDKLPQKFKENMQKLLGSEYSAYIESFDKPIYKGIRINTSKVTNWEAISPFAEMEAVPWCAEGRYYADERPAKHPYYAAGLYYIQEPSAMAVAALLPIEKDDRVLDLCAAPGGKSTQVVAKLGPKGVLVANDISFSRARTLEKNLEGFGAKNTMIVSEDPKKLAKLWANYFDKIIIDAPCSGEGMFRKDEKAIKSWENFEIDHFCQIQTEILESAAKMLKTGGMMVYSTCTFATAENESCIEQFLETHADFESVAVEIKNGLSDGFGNIGAVRLWPHKIKGEGHFVCLLIKKLGNNVFDKYIKLSKRIKDYPEANLFFKENTSINLDEYVVKNNNSLYLVSANMPANEKIRTLRSGLYLGDIKSGKFIPSHALAIAYDKSVFKNTINYQSADIEVTKYLKGETLFADVCNGYYVICVDNFPIGWAKAVNGILKNKYPASRAVL